MATLEKDRATVEAMEASRDHAKLYADWTTVKAPIGGRISRRFVDPGNLVLPIHLGLLAFGRPFFARWVGAPYAEWCFPAMAVLSDHHWPDPIAGQRDDAVAAIAHRGLWARTGRPTAPAGCRVRGCAAGEPVRHDRSGGSPSMATSRPARC